MATNQPKWELVANLGDASPIEHGGYFVYRDTTGVYCAEAELWEPEEKRAYRFCLEQCTLVNGVLSDNRYHPEHAAWFAERLSSVADYVCNSLEELQRMLCSADAIERARAYRDIGGYYGFENLGGYPLQLTRAEAEARYASKGR